MNLSAFYQIQMHFLHGNTSIIVGCWTERKVLNERDVLKLPVREGLPIDVAAMLSVNPCTAYRMLKDFEQLQEGMKFMTRD